MPFVWVFFCEVEGDSSEQGENVNELQNQNDDLHNANTICSVKKVICTKTILTKLMFCGSYRAAYVGNVNPPQARHNLLEIGENVSEQNLSIHSL